jgi:ankyrin repeat protein
LRSQSLLKLLKNHNEESLVALIKQKSLNINVRDEEDRNALHWAAAEGKCKIAAAQIVIITINTIASKDIDSEK